jgi:hypothetical protein
MKCEKCNSETEENCKFCPQCGKKFEPIETSTDLVELTSKALNAWFTMGVNYGILYERKDKKNIDEFEKILTDNDADSMGSKSIKFAKEIFLNKLQEKEKDSNANAH